MAGSYSTCFLITFFQVLYQRILSIGAYVFNYPSPSWASKEYNREMIPEEFMDFIELQLFQSSYQSDVNLLQWMLPVSRE